METIERILAALREARGKDTAWNTDVLGFEYAPGKGFRLNSYGAPLGGEFARASTRAHWPSPEEAMTQWLAGVRRDLDDAANEEKRSLERTRNIGEALAETLKALGR